ncbi:mitochondrial import inner membrane translocase subunit Tim13 [Cyclopterus lumpus]|uniref:mitochondrial import inner membrane translocase subunit Tim13 n=1 Tax=Cyclopterus lumpus TaxID=8103 RepID=UPI0014862218|nr:mitochondrial import inner membrane translocase subunit Tim13 [Cyclopterus lumpus]
MSSSVAVKGIEKLTLAKPSSSCPHVHLQKIDTAAASVATPVEMDGFGSEFPAGGSGGKVDTGTIMEQVKVQIAVANAQELLQRMTDKCFKKCIGKPGSTLDNSEQKCIAMCMDRYMDAWNTVSRTYNSRLQRERARM